MSVPVLAAIASIPEREQLLPLALESLRAQADRICVYLNGYERVPEWLPRLANEIHHEPVNRGAERKFHWADKHDGYYFTCDDDIVYPRNYVTTMIEAILERGPRCLVTCHAKTYIGRPRTVHELAPTGFGMFLKRVDFTQPANHAGTGVMGWDTRVLKVPTEWPLQNIADMQVAVWAQQQRVPIWLVAHQAHWFKALAAGDSNGIFANSAREHHRRRNELLFEQGSKAYWQLFGVD